MAAPLRVLVLEDRPADAELMVAELRRQGFAPEWTRVESEDDFVAALGQPFDVILSDFNLPDFDALRAIGHVRRLALTIPVIVVTGAVGEETAAQCIREGAADYLLKDRLARLGLAVSQAVERRRLADQRRQIESALAASQDELATVFDSAPVAMVIVDGNRRVVRANRAAARLAERPPGETFGLLPGVVFGCRNADNDRGGCGAGIECQECPLNSLVIDTLTRGTSLGGVECTLPFGASDVETDPTILVSSSPITTQMGTLAVVALEDITERRRARDRERRLSTLLGTIRDINQLIVRESDRDWILAESCRILTERTGFTLAWICEEDRDTGLVRPLAVAGDASGAEAVSRIQPQIDGHPEDLSPIGTAIRSGRSVVIGDIAASDLPGPWREAALSLGYRSKSVIPLEVNERRFGAMAVLGSRVGDFDEEIVGLLEELADDIGFALGALETAADRKRVVQDLHDSEERYRSLFEQAPIGIYRTTPEGRILAANPALVGMLGYDSFKQLADRDLRREGFADPDARTAFLSAMDAAGRVTGFEAEWRTRDGQPLFVRENASAVTDADGTLLFFEGTVENITEAHQTRQQRDLLFDLAIDMFGVAGFDGFFKQLNPAWEENLGWTRDELLGKAFLSFIHPADRPAAVEAYRRLGEGHRVTGIENRVRCRDGSHRWLSWNAHPVPSENLVLAVAHDTTARRRLEEQLLQSQKMEAVGRLAGGVAHDFNNLLQALLSQTQLVRSHRHDPAALEKVGDELEQQIQRGAALTRQLLLFSRRETTQRALLDLNHVVRDEAALLRRLTRANIALDIELSELELPVSADRGQLEQVLMNLVVNASDALPDEGGRIAIRSGAEGEAAVWFSVEDNGPGVPQELRRNIFEPFFTTKPAFEGTGLGLSVVHGIVMRHDGRISVEDRDGGGAMFKVVLPRADNTGHRQPAPEGAAAQPPAGHGERVLVVEDEEATRTGIADLLDALGYRVEAVGSAEEALEAPASAPFDVLLTDLMLPGMAGSELAEELRRRWPRLHVLLMSGYTEDAAVRMGIGAGTLTFLQKPFEMRALATHLRRALDGDLPGEAQPPP